MPGSRLGLIAVAALLSGSAGCALPQVLPLEGGTSAGPSPYGVWYEQHWATNAVLLAAADQPEEEVVAAPAAEAEAEVTVSVDSEIGETVYTPESGEYADPIDADAEAAAREARAAADAAAAEANAAVEAAVSGAEDFDNSSPYQFPASSFAPGADEEAPPAGAADPQDGEPIRY
jgi:hypothetical protein